MSNKNPKKESLLERMKNSPISLVFTGFSSAITLFAAILALGNFQPVQKDTFVYKWDLQAQIGKDYVSINTYNDLKGENNDLKRENNDLNNENKNLKGTVELLKSKDKSLIFNKIKQLEEERDKLIQEIKTLEVRRSSIIIGGSSPETTEEKLLKEKLAHIYDSITEINKNLKN